MKFAIVGGAIVAAFLAYLLLRRAPQPTPPKVAREEACFHPPEERLAPSPPEIAKARAEFRARMPEISRAEGKVERLNALQERLTVQLRQGTITARDILEQLQRETDMAVLDVLIGSLQSYPPSGNLPEVLDYFLRTSREEASRDRRLLALAFLGNAWDQTGEIRRTLTGLVRSDPNEGIRIAALVSLGEYTIRNHSTAADLNNELLTFATDPTPAIRAAALGALNMMEAGGAVVQGVIACIADPALEVRVAAYERLGGGRPEFAPMVMTRLEEAFWRETDGVAMGQAVAALVRVGQSEALPVLRRLAQRNSPVREEIWAAVHTLEGAR